MCLGFVMGEKFGRLHDGLDGRVGAFRLKPSSGNVMFVVTQGNLDLIFALKV